VGYEPAPGTASQTAWALLGLMAASEADHPAVARGIAYLAATQGEDGLWSEPFHSETGFRAFSTCAITVILVFSAWGDGPLSQPQARQQPSACV
jgi:squalene cyclase